MAGLAWCVLVRSPASLPATSRRRVRWSGGAGECGACVAVPDVLAEALAGLPWAPGPGRSRWALTENLRASTPGVRSSTSRGSTSRPRRSRRAAGRRSRRRARRRFDSCRARRPVPGAVAASGSRASVRGGQSRLEGRRRDARPPWHPAPSPPSGARPGGIAPRCLYGHRGSGPARSRRAGPSCRPPRNAPDRLVALGC